MAHPSIGGQNFLIMRGAKCHVSATSIENIHRQGAHGEAFRDEGKRAPVVNVSTVADCANAGSTSDAYRALKGTLVTVIYPDGQTFATVMVLEVVITEARRVLTPVGGLVGGQWLVSAEWHLQNGAVPA